MPVAGHLGATHPDNWPENRLGIAARVVPIRSCSRWGLPGPPPLLARAVGSYPTFSPLPCRQAGKAVYFCGTFPRVGGHFRARSPAGCYPASCFHGARTFLPRGVSTDAGAATRPAGDCGIHKFPTAGNNSRTSGRALRMSNQQIIPKELGVRAHSRKVCSGFWIRIHTTTDQIEPVERFNLRETCASACHPKVGTGFG